MIDPVHLAPEPRQARRDSLERPRDLSRPLPGWVSWAALTLFVALFGFAIVTLGLPPWLPILYLAVSVLTFVLYGYDKSAARRQRQRVSEQTLLALGILCGWPGALIAQQALRHKTRKRSFRRAFWRTVVLNVLLLAAFVTLATVRGWDLDPSWLGSLIPRGPRA